MMIQLLKSCVGNQDEAAISEEIDDHVDELSDEDDISTEALLEELQDDEDTTEAT